MAQAKYTVAFIGIIPDGNLYIIRQFKGTFAECARWKRENREGVKKSYGKIHSVTVKHKK